MSKRLAFIITPIGEENAPIRRATDGLIDAVIEPVMHEIGLEAVVAHRLPDAGSITTQVLRHVLEDDLVVANVSNLNPNVMYELAVRHCKRRPVVLLAEEGTRLPFDFNDQRTVFYRDDMKGAVELAPKLKSFCEAALAEVEPDNPVYRAASVNVLQDAIAPNSELEAVFGRMNQLEASILSALAPKIVKPDPRGGLWATQYFVVINTKISNAAQLRQKLNTALPDIVISGITATATIRTNAVDNLDLIHQYHFSFSSPTPITERMILNSLEGEAPQIVKFFEPGISNS